MNISRKLKIIEINNKLKNIGKEEEFKDKYRTEKNQYLTLEYLDNKRIKSKLEYFIKYNLKNTIYNNIYEYYDGKKHEEFSQYLNLELIQLDIHFNNFKNKLYDTKNIYDINIIYYRENKKKRKKYIMNIMEDLNIEDLEDFNIENIKI